MATVGYATLQIIPAIRGISQKISSDIGVPMATAGRRAGQSLSENMASGAAQAKAAVEKAATDVARAQAKAADATGRVRVEQAKLDTLRQKGVTDAGRLATAEESVARAMRNQTVRAREATAAEQNLTTAKKQASDASDRSSGSTSRLSEGLSRIGIGSGSAIRGLAGLAAKATGVASVGAIAMSAFTRGFSRLDSIDQAQAKMRGLGMDAQAIEGLMESANKAVKGTAFGLDEAATAASMASAAGVKSGQDMDSYLTTVADTAALAGSSMSEMSSIFGKVATSGKVQGDVLAQLGDRGVAVTKMLAEEMGVAQTEVAALASKGEIDFATFQAAMERGTAGAAAEAGNTFRGSLANMNAALGRFGAALLSPAFNALPAIFGFLTDGINKVNTLVGPFVSNVVDKFRNLFSGLGSGGLDLSGITDTLSGMWSTVAPILEDLAGRFRGLAENIGSLLSAHLQNAIAIFQTMVGVLRTLWPVISVIGQVVGAVVVVAFRSLVSVISGAVAALATVTRFVGENRGAFIAIAAVLGSLFLPALLSTIAAAVTKAAVFGTIGVAIKAYTVATKVAAIATKAFAVAQNFLKAAFLGNPIGLLIAGLVALVAAVVLAWRNSETFRNIVIGAWNAIKVAFEAVWNWISGTLWPGIQGVWNGIAAGAIWLWNALGTAWSAIQTAIGAVWTWIQTVLWPGLQAVWSGLSTGVMWLWQNAIQPAWTGIQMIITAVWNIIKGYFTLWMNAFRLVGSVATWLWSNAIAPAFGGIRTAAQFLWSGVSTIFNLFRSGMQALGAAVSAVANATIRPAWNAIKAGADALWNGLKTIFGWIQRGWQLLGDGIRVVIDSVIKPAWEGMKSALGSVRDFFGTVVDGIKAAWDKVKGYVATPINFVIETVWNNGLLKAWNTIAGFLPGLKQMSPLSPVSFATGGAVAGPGTGTSDSIPARLSHGEHVLTAAEVRALGGQTRVYAMRRAIHTGDFPGEGGVMAFRSGGAVDDEDVPDSGGRLQPSAGEGGLKPIAILAKRLIHRIWPHISDIGGYRQDAFPEHPSGRALDVMIGSDMKTGDEVNSWILANHKILPLIHNLWRQQVWTPDGGKSMMEDRGSPTQNHMDHVHAWYQDGINVDPNVVPEGLVGHDGLTDEDRIGVLKQRVIDIIDSALNPIKEGMERVIGSPPPEWLGIPPKALDETKLKAVDAAFEIVENLGEALKEVYDKAKEIGKAVTSVLTFGLIRDTGGFLPTGQSIVTNETGKPEAVLNWEQLEEVRGLMDDGMSLSDAAARVGTEPDGEEIPEDAIVLAHDATAEDVAEAAEKLKAATEAQQQTQQAPSGPTTTPDAGEDDPMAGSAPPSTGDGTADQSPGRMKSFTELGRDAGGIIADGIAETLGLPSWITDPGNAIKADDGSNVRVTDQGSTTGTTTNNNTTTGGDDLTYGDGSTFQPGETELSEMPDYEPEGWLKYPFAITEQAKKMKLPKRAAIIGNATALVEVGDPMKMYANNSVPESLKFDHDAVGSDHDSVGLFQQRDNGAWGTVADRMDPHRSAAMFYEALKQVSGWESMDMGAAAQAVQRSAFPGRYSGQVPRATSLVDDTKLYDRGGWLMPGAMAYNALNEPEPVLTPDHWRSVVDQTSAVRELVGSGARGGRVQNVTIYGHTAGDIISEFGRHEWRGSGGYGGRER